MVLLRSRANMLIRFETDRATSGWSDGGLGERALAIAGARAVALAVPLHAPGIERREGRHERARRPPPEQARGDPDRQRREPLDVVSPYVADLARPRQVLGDPCLHR